MKSLHVIIVVLCTTSVLAGAWMAHRGSRVDPPHPLSTWDPADPALGRKAYTMCQACHGVDGRGVPGYAPALTGSRWLTGDPRAAILITLHGYDATSEPGAAYVSSRMLGHGHQLADHEIAGLLSWTRNQWGNSAPIIERAAVTTLRSHYVGRSVPWSPAELRTVVRQP